MSIERYRSLIETEIRLFIEQMGEKNELRDACEYALLNGGKRLRPILVLLTAESLGHGLDVLPVALSVEFFHTASLIADDLPCMDDDAIRRDLPSLHKAFGESVAILASYALIAEGYGGIYRNSRKNPKADAMLCLEAATRCAGIQGATNGQFLDLFCKEMTIDSIKKIIYQKTVTLFEISFIFGWIFGGGDPKDLPKVQRSAYHLGMAFQIGDDLLDALQDSQASSSSIISVCGKEEARRLFVEEASLFETSLKELGLWNDAFKEVLDWLYGYVHLGGTKGHPKGN